MPGFFAYNLYIALHIEISIIEEIQRIKYAIIAGYSQ